MAVDTRPSERTGPARTTVAARTATRRSGIGFCLVAAACFGALPVLGKGAYGDGAGPLELLWARFGIAAAVFWVLVPLFVRRPQPRLRFLVAGVLMGFCGYALEAGLFFLALERIDASLVELLLYAYPAIVTVVALALGREAPAPRLLSALFLASVGVVLVFAGSLATGVDPVGLALGLGAAVVYAGYVLAGERVVATVHPLLLAALVSTGATAAFSVVGFLRAGRGSLPIPTSGAAWWAAGVMAVVATVVPMAALFAGIRRVGAATATIVSTLEPVVTVALATVFLAEQLSVVEAAGAACVLLAVRLLAPAPSRPLLVSGNPMEPTSAVTKVPRWYFRDRKT